MVTLKNWQRYCTSILSKQWLLPSFTHKILHESELETNRFLPRLSTRLAASTSFMSDTAMNITKFKNDDPHWVRKAQVIGWHLNWVLSTSWLVQNCELARQNLSPADAARRVSNPVTVMGKSGRRKLLVNCVVSFKGGISFHLNILNLWGG